MSEASFEFCLKELAGGVKDPVYSLPALNMAERVASRFRRDLFERVETIAREQGAETVTPVIVARAARELGRPIDNHQLKPE